MKEILTHFPTLTDLQIRQFEAVGDLYKEWNNKINVISRKDIDNLYLHHLLHSLAIARYVTFANGTRIMDVGTGGGFPGIPLAILFPESHFLLLDSIGKKIRVVREIAEAIGLTNVEAIQSRAEEEKRKFHFVVSRAVMPLPDLIRIIRKNIAKEQINALPNGIICLKGGELTAELHPFRQVAEEVALSNYFSDPFFQTKKLVYVPLG
ncbi:MAG: Ribosomal RNA small subunit methyltransferase G [Proteiniphilum acetatigenes]|uniref:Ribosomal RNA small subunit methyltransferase G n=1 Tax=Proteiniphilum acetatigenes TaxID=294710 RepID=A0A101HKK7_9BACT|nr:MAG: Ribosomal RNA small subunit methyltransferase G [Proteiniphilum acetatigenes]KUL19782.1 MAG: Ribosomal RNA small subunit methyltransferase G [Proteiniphilum sp. 51_7]HCC85241.1 16S rRNA (guanine(527)-N(7))-methyltransferase RsmG [Porphyromonadaceae bacterium]